MPHRPGVWAIVALLGGNRVRIGTAFFGGFPVAGGRRRGAGEGRVRGSGCSNCHEVAGAELPRPANPPVQRVLLGGEGGREIGDGKLVKWIIAPSPQVRNGLAMPHIAEEMTVRQLTDIVAFLQSHYTLRRLTPTWTYY